MAALRCGWGQSRSVCSPPESWLWFPAPWTKVSLKVTRTLAICLGKRPCSVGRGVPKSSVAHTRDSKAACSHLVLSPPPWGLGTGACLHPPLGGVTCQSSLPYTLECRFPDAGEGQHPLQCFSRPGCHLLRRLCLQDPLGEDLSVPHSPLPAAHRGPRREQVWPECGASGLHVCWDTGPPRGDGFTVHLPFTSQQTS